MPTRIVTIRQHIGLEETIIKEIEQNQLTWYGHIQRIAEERLPKIALKWMPKQKRARGRPKKNWMEGIKKAMNERNLSEGQWEDRKQWNLGVGQRRKTFEPDIYIHTKCQLDATDVFLLQILLLAQHVSGTTMPIIRSSRVLYSGCCLWYFVWS